MRYTPDYNIAQSNLTRDKKSICLSNIRQHRDQLDFDQVGFGKIQLSSQMAYDDFEDEERLKAVYRIEIAA